MDNYIFKKSTMKNKKYDVFDKTTKKKIASFGDINYQHFKDKTPLRLYSHLDHNDIQRRNSYYARHGKQAKKNSAKYFSHKYLW